MANLKQINTIAYDKELRDLLKQAHDTLGESVTDIANKSMQSTMTLVDDARTELSRLSQMASELSIALINAKGDKRLDLDEQTHFDQVKDFAGRLGNIQFRINRIIRTFDERAKLDGEINTLSLSLAQEIMDTNDVIHSLRASMNALGLYSNDKDLARIADEENGTI